MIQILIAASALYEAVEPNAVWRQLFNTVRDEILGATQTHEGTKLIEFILHTFRAHDEEVQRIHLPLCFTAFLELLSVSIHPANYTITDICVNIKAKLEGSKVSSRNTLGTLVLLSDMLSYMPPSALTSLPQFSATPTAYVNAYQRAAAAYGLEGTFTARQNGHSLAPLATAAEDLLTIISLFSTNTVQPYESSNDDVFATAAKLLGSLIVKAQEKPANPFKIVWDIRKWLGDMLSFLDEVCTRNIKYWSLLTCFRALRQSPSLSWTAPSRYSFSSTSQRCSNQGLT